MQNTLELPSFPLPLASSLGAGLLEKAFAGVVRRGELRVIDSSGRSFRVGDGASPGVTIRLTKPVSFRKMLLRPSLFLGEAYMDGDLTIESGSLKDLFDVLFINMPAGTSAGWLGLEDVWNHLLRRFQQINTPMRSRNNVSHHYDLSISFYELFLDPEKQYSCAYFADGDESLEEAQDKKMRHIARKLLLQPGQTVLDIGCGWGGLSCFLAREFGAQVTGITLSKEQLNYARNRAKQEGLGRLTKFRLIDYRALDKKFDRIVSVGMFEHVGLNFYGTFFRQARRLLADDGVMLLHSIGHAHGPGATNPWIRKYIFPGGYIPSLSEVLPSVEKSGLYVQDIEILRLHYARTLQEWHGFFEKHGDEVRHLYGDRFYRMWEFYLLGSQASFEHLGNMVFQLQLGHHPDSTPLTRDYIYRGNGRRQFQKKLS